MSSVTVHGSICKLRRAAQYIAPGRDFTWLAESETTSHRGAAALEIRPHGHGRGSSRSRADLDPRGRNLSDLDRACPSVPGSQWADGGVARMCPVRPKNFAALEIGRSFVKINGTWWIVLSASETKEKRPDERPINELITPAIDRYLGQYRPVLARAGNSSSALWLCCNNGAPIKDRRTLREVISATTLATVGVA